MIEINSVFEEVAIKNWSQCNFLYTIIELFSKSTIQRPNDKYIGKYINLIVNMENVKS